MCDVGYGIGGDDQHPGGPPEQAAGWVEPRGRGLCHLCSPAQGHRTLSPHRALVERQGGAENQEEGSVQDPVRGQTEMGSWGGFPKETGIQTLPRTSWLVRRKRGV